MNIYTIGKSFEINKYLFFSWSFMFACV